MTGLPSVTKIVTDGSNRVGALRITGVNGNPIPVTITSGSTSSTPNIINLSVPLADVEVSQALTNGATQILIRVRGNAKAQFSFSNGQSGTNFITIPPGATFEAKNLNLNSTTLYIQCNKPTQTIEILEWT